MTQYLYNSGGLTGFVQFFSRWPEIYRMKVKDKNFGIETPGETVYFKMVSVKIGTDVLPQSFKFSILKSHVLTGLKSPYNITCIMQ